MSRRDWLAAFARASAAFTATAFAPRGVASATGTATGFAAVEPGTRIGFPRDHGAHPRYRTEWWYLTGWLVAGTFEFGVQVTFFRARTAHDDANPSRFAPRQLLLAHAALALPDEPALRHAQRAARTGFGLVEASETDCDLRLDAWSLSRSPHDVYRARLSADRFDIDLSLRAPGAPVLQGDGGFSRKGPLQRQASHYYSRPQLSMRAQIGLRSDTAPARELDAAGVGWLDHEWSSELLDPRAVGWDWIGINFVDGSALMAFRIRARDGTEVWSNARWIAPARAGSHASDGDGEAVRFEPLRHWRSVRSSAQYPVQMLVTVGARAIELRPLLDDQELDARASTGIIYWEGAIRAFESGRQTGRGYLELTGYATPVRL